jgi:hypothetical protein
MKLPENIQEFFRKHGSAGGKKRAANLSAEERSAIARKAVQTRWAKAGKKRKKKSRGEK